MLANNVAPFTVYPEASLQGTYSLQIQKVAWVDTQHPSWAIAPGYGTIPQEGKTTLALIEMRGTIIPLMR